MFFEGNNYQNGGCFFRNQSNFNAQGGNACSNIGRLVFMLHWLSKVELSCSGGGVGDFKIESRVTEWNNRY